MGSDSPTRSLPLPHLLLLLLQHLLPVQRLLALEPGGGGAEGGGGGGAGGGGVDQAEEVVVGVELPDVTDGFTGRPLRASWGEREKFDQKL